MNRRVIAACVLFLLASTTIADAQVVVVNGRRMPSRRPQFRIQEVEVNATIKDQAATVQMAQVFENQSSFTCVLPVWSPSAPFPASSTQSSSSVYRFPDSVS